MKDKAAAVTWRPIGTFDGSPVDRVDLWLQWGASARTLCEDSFRVPDAWRDEDGRWKHIFEGKPTELRGEFVTHWMPRPLGPNGETHY